MEVRPNDQYVVKVDGSGRLTVRNRKSLKPIKPVKEALKQLQQELTDDEPRRSDRLAGKKVAMLAQVFHRPWE